MDNSLHHKIMRVLISCMTHTVFFGVNSKELRGEVFYKVLIYLEYLLDKQEIVSFKIQCDDKNNTLQVLSESDFVIEVDYTEPNKEEIKVKYTFNQYLQENWKW